MKQVLSSGLFTLTVLLAGQSLAQAQTPAVPGGYARPNYFGGYQGASVLSPWLNLGLGTGNPAINYYLGVLPEVARRTDERRFGAAITDIDRRLGATLEPDELFAPLSGTGHPSAFMNYGGYFNMGRGGPTHALGNSAPVKQPAK
jgi:hypothetical protein